MAKRTIRYKKPEWREWVYIILEADEIDAYVEALKDQGYQVEK